MKKEEQNQTHEEKKEMERNKRKGLKGKELNGRRNNELKRQ
jgi:hypothetical protein